MYGSGLFEEIFLEEWEDSADQSWTTTRDIFTKEYDVIMRATNREAQQSGYDSADALHEHHPTTPTSMPTAATTNEYDAMAEYAAALEEQITALQTSNGAQSVVSDFASSASTINAESTLLKEMRSERKKKAV